MQGSPLLHTAVQYQRVTASFVTAMQLQLPVAAVLALACARLALTGSH
jgi:hypothetical protein